MAYSALVRALALLTAAGVLASCAPHARYGVSELAAAYNQPYFLDSGDRLRITVFGQNDLTRVYPVDGGGHVAMPLIGAVPARGATAGQLEGMIASRLAAGYLRNPDVRVEVETHRPFFILGEVQRAGQYPYVAGMTVETAVAIAGGYTYRANQASVDIARKTEAEIIRAVAPPDTPILPGDTIVVRERFF